MYSSRPLTKLDAYPSMQVQINRAIRIKDFDCGIERIQGSSSICESFSRVRPISSARAARCLARPELIEASSIGEYNLI